MKTTIVLKEFSALPSGALQATPASAPANRESSPQRMSDSVQRFAVRQIKNAEKFREMLHRRETTPLASAISYRQFGINE